MLAPLLVAWLPREFCPRGFSGTAGETDFAPTEVEIATQGFFGKAEEKPGVSLSLNAICTNLNHFVQPKTEGGVLVPGCVFFVPDHHRGIPAPSSYVSEA